MPGLVAVVHHLKDAAVAADDVVSGYSRGGVEEMLDGAVDVPAGGVVHDDTPDPLAVATGRVRALDELLDQRLGGLLAGAVIGVTCHVLGPLLEVAWIGAARVPSWASLLSFGLLIGRLLHLV